MTRTLRTQSDVFGLPLPAAGETIFWDEGKPKDRAPGLGLRLRSGGSRKWVFFYRLGGRQFKHTIGDASAWPIEKARREARALRAKVDTGQNPAADKVQSRAAASLIFGNVVDDYLAARAKTMKPRSLVEITRHLRKAWKPVHGLAVGAVTRQLVAGHLRKMAESRGPIAANRARATLSAFYGWAIAEGLCETNPVDGTNKPAEESARERVLSDAELAAIWKAAPDGEYGRIVKLLMLTGQRRDEVGGLRWSEVDRENKVLVLPATRTKNSRQHEVPLSDLALSVVDECDHRDDRELVFGRGEGGFSGWSKAKSALDEACGVQGWTLHDLRRTAATRMADLGVQPHVIEAVLNHVSGHKAGVAGIYNRSTYATEKRTALDLWAGHIKVLLAKAAGANVVALKGAG